MLSFEKYKDTDLITVKELSDLLSVTPNTVYQYVLKKKLPEPTIQLGKRMWRIGLLKAFLNLTNENNSAN